MSFDGVGGAAHDPASSEAIVRVANQLVLGRAKQAVVPFVAAAGYLGGAFGRPVSAEKDKRLADQGGRFRLAFRVDAVHARAHGLPHDDVALSEWLTQQENALHALFTGRPPVFDGAHRLALDTVDGDHHATRERFRVALWWVGVDLKIWKAR